MTSFQANVAIRILRWHFRRRRLTDPDAYQEALDEINNSAVHIPLITELAPEPWWGLHRQCRVTRSEHDGMAVYKIAPKKGAGPRQLLYLHGGAYIQDITTEHWKFIEWLVQGLNCTAIVPIYPLAPHKQAIEVVPDILTLYEQVVAETDPELVTLMGDSAGGGMALAVAELAQLFGIPRAKDIILISPWLDISLSDPAIAELEQEDPWLTVSGLLAAGKAYCGELDVRNALVSPLYGDLTGLGRITVITGTCDILNADARRLRERATQDNLDLQFLEYDGLFHVFPLATIPEGLAARRQIVNTVLAA